MADVEKLKELLRVGAIKARKSATAQEIDEAAEQLKGKVRVGQKDLQEIGQAVAHDPEVFASTDIDDINTVLARGRDQ